MMKNLLLLACSMMLTIAVAESAARILYPAYKDYNTEMWRYASYLKQPTGFPELPFTNRPGSELNLYGVDIKINSRGLRDREYPYEKTRKRAIVLGDSMTFGWGVRENDTYAKQLEGMAGIDVINMGAGNYNTQMELELLRSEGLKYHPDIVILGFFANDVEPTPSFSLYGLKSSSYLFSFLSDRLIKISHNGFTPDSYVKYYESAYSSQYRDKASQALKEIEDLCRKSNVTLVVINIPDIYLDENTNSSYADSFIRENLTNSTRYLDLTPFFTEKSSAYWVSAEDQHMNAKAHTIIAKAVYASFDDLWQQESAAG